MEMTGQNIQQDAYLLGKVIACRCSNYEERQLVWKQSETR